MTLSNFALDLTEPDRSPEGLALVRAKDLIAKGKFTAAAALCEKTLVAARPRALTASALIDTMRAAGEPLRAEAHQTALIAELRAMAPPDPRLCLNLGRLLYSLDQTDAARDMLAVALPHHPQDMAAVRVLTSLLLAKDKPAEAIALWQPAFAAHPTDGRSRLLLARMLAHAGCLMEANQILDLAEPLCADKSAEFAYIAAGIRGTATAQSQAAMSVQVFDGFAQNYDQILAKIGNRGPDLTAKLLAALALPKRLDILDAGCGTGLCAPLLRPLAKSLHGVDSSIGMLQQSRKKSCYDLLTRSDLASIGTLPPGPFDLIVSSDVLVYFGDLAQVLTNFAKLTRAGGWLVVTLEDAGAQGWHLAPSGRHKHSLAYLKSALTAAGFSAPKVTMTADLRQELGTPVAGLGIAAQRLAVFG